LTTKRKRVGQDILWLREKKKKEEGGEGPTAFLLSVLQETDTGETSIKKEKKLPQCPGGINIEGAAQ